LEHLFKKIGNFEPAEPRLYAGYPEIITGKKRA